MIAERPVTESGSVVAKAGTYISGTVTNRVEILTANLGFSTTPNWEKLFSD